QIRKSPRCSSSAPGTQRGSKPAGQARRSPPTDTRPHGCSSDCSPVDSCDEDTDRSPPGNSVSVWGGPLHGLPDRLHGLAPAVPRTKQKGPCIAARAFSLTGGEWRSDHALGQHGVGNLHEAGDVGALHVVDEAVLFAAVAHAG